MKILNIYPQHSINFIPLLPKFIPSNQMEHKRTQKKYQNSINLHICFEINEFGHSYDSWRQYHPPS